ncbi:uncharacterized protein HMPREF1541_03285 [Cyphellophora europaea CBS 101466]|uniref:C2H2-type domain-containing protein n=1 Tax=Cyphellophora europaea (strain CBS 101466) TaxID=1220924 RepID=W2RYE3_CYPE1|nr:uncharacterized protein HMPREF1541_03285 [Cyphellophora europaea CBS 101466]ETN41350.1 hypothetical protein HMPREF1541_03285 [Cyphellophora europaea CBS 101466]
MTSLFPATSTKHFYIAHKIVLMLVMASRETIVEQRRNQRDSKRKCPVCARTFSKTEHLERHVRSHTKEKPFECQYCGRKYGRNDSLLRHTKDQHRDDAPPPSASSKDQRMLNQSPNDQPLSSTSSHDPNIGVSVLDGLNGMPMTPYEASLEPQNPFNTRSAGPSHWSSSLGVHDNPSWDNYQTTFGSVNWLSYGNLDDSLLRDWPFLIDDSDPGIIRVDAAHGKSKAIADLQQSWHTHLENGETNEAGVSGYTTPLPGQSQDVDDNYRQSLHRRLQIRIPDENLPSADFLNLCVRTYFERFHPVFPIVHAATFRPSKTNAVLLLSMCSIGSLFTGHPDAVPRGIRLFERLNKAILSNWEMLMRRGPDDTFAMMQAALLGQTFGLLTGQGKHLVLVDTFHGTIVAWARRSKIFHEYHQPLNDQDLEARWRKWAQTEEKIRLGLAIRIHDAEIASTLHHEAFLPLNPRRMSLAQTDALFLAPNFLEWAALSQDGSSDLATPSSEVSPGSTIPEILHERLLSIPLNCHFSIYSTLEDVLSAILQARIDETLTEDYVHSVHACLMAFRRQYGQNSSASPAEPLRGGNLILWHFNFINLYADMNLLEKSVGRDGPELRPSDLAKTIEWARSDDAKRSVAHALAIKKSLEGFRLTSEPGIHVPRAMFCSAVCLFCQAKYGDGGNQSLPCTFPELQLFDTNVTSSIRTAREPQSTGGDGSKSVYNFVDLLQRIGHWQISRKFASILSVLIHTETSQ